MCNRRNRVGQIKEDLSVKRYKNIKLTFLYNANINNIQMSGNIYILCRCLQQPINFLWFVVESSDGGCSSSFCVSVQKF